MKKKKLSCSDCVKDLIDLADRLKDVDEPLSDELQDELNNTLRKTESNLETLMFSLMNELLVTEGTIDNPDDYDTEELHELHTRMLKNMGNGCTESPNDSESEQPNSDVNNAVDTDEKE